MFHGRAATARMAIVICALTSLVLPVSAAAQAGPVAQAAPAVWQRGVNFNTYTADAYGTSDADASLQRAAAAGNDSVEIVTTWYQLNRFSTLLAPEPQRTPTDASLLHAMQKARSLGLKVTLKPHVNVLDHSWRGSIKPVDRDAWYANYHRMIAHYADLATQGGASMFVVGTELKGMSTDTSRWRAVVADVRSRFRGKLTYAASYKEFQQVQFWDALDFIGVDAYFALTDVVGETTARLTERWTSWQWKSQLVIVAFTFGKPVIFTELGYRSTPDTALHPGYWSWWGEIDLAAQQRAYEAFYQAFKDEGWFAGVYWWNWPARAPRSGGWDNDYPVWGKPAEQTMTTWNARLKGRGLIGGASPPGGG